MNPPYKKIVWRNILPLANYVICPTVDYVEPITHKYNIERHKCVIIPSGINMADFRRKPSQSISTPVKILSVGRLSSQKNIPRLLAAFCLFQSRYKAVLHIIGAGEDKQLIERLIRDNDISNVFLEGEIRGAKLADFYASSDIFVLTSDFESFGIVNLEAMASGLPIVASIYLE